MFKEAIMDYPRFRSIMHHSAEQYLAYLNEQFSKGDRYAGRNVVSVWEIRPGILPTDLYLTTAERIIQPDHCQIWIRGIRMDDIRILQVLKSEGHTHAIMIRDEGDSLKAFGKLYPHDIQIISDMTFLIHRLRDFYLKNEFSFTPPAPGPIPELPVQFTEGLSEEQLAAVNGVFNAPVSYINGAPGTGKTRMVMSRCVLRYILNGKRVFLLAPTNNAVEQMLRSILPVLKESGIDLEKVYRFGTSTEEFAKQYPQVTADAAADTLRENLLQQISFLEKQLEKARRIHRVKNNCHRSLEVCVPLQEKILHLLTVHQKCYHAYSEAFTNEKQANESLAMCEKALQAIQELLQKLTLECDSIQSKIVEKTHLSNKLSYRLWQKKARAELIKETDNLRQQLILPLRQLEETKKDETEHLLNLSKEQQHLRVCKSALEDASRKLSNAFTDIETATSIDGIFHDFIMDRILNTDPSQMLDDFFTKRKLDCEKWDEEAAKLPLDHLEAEYNKIKIQLNNIGLSAKQLQRQNALVYAATIDAAIRVLDSDEPADKTIPISHVFLDEAGYTSLARGMVAFACGAPVTFLGDHRQLPPICEMNRIQPNNAPVCLWALSIAYYHELVNGDFRDLYNRCYCGEAEPSFQSISRFSLNLSYRFGPELAAILAKFIYDEHFHGIAGAPFDVEIIDAPYTPGPYNRSSLSEASGVARYIQAHPNDDFAVLAPYRGQIKLLRETLPPYYKDSILTVHRSQGREWDTVIFSVVDGRSPYFVDSNLPIGRAVLNTAISRTRRKLVLVCDTSAWMGKHNQIITSIIQNASHDRSTTNIQS